MGKSSAVHKVVSPLKDELFLWQLRGTEELGQPFEYSVDLLSEKADLDYTKLLGATIGIQVGGEQPRWFHGHVCQFGQIGRYGAYHHYHAVLRPWFWLLTQTADCRIFQDKTVPEIFKAVCKDTHKFSDFKDMLTDTYRKRVYCVQYRETDFDFLSRILEFEGIYYYFQHSESKHELVLCDGRNAHQPIAGNSKLPYRAPGEAVIDQEHVYAWQNSFAIQPGTYVHDDYNFEKPKAALLAKSKVTVKHPQADYEFYEYPGAYPEAKDGEKYAKVQIQSRHAEHKRFRASSDAHGIAAGGLFELQEFPRKDQNGEYLIVAAEIVVISGEVEQFSEDAENQFDVQLTAIESNQPYRSPLRTPKPKIVGPQSAVVVGKSGEEIWTDKHGRVKIQFQWDREGKSDENSSCWVRVSHTFAGKAWGAVNIPRIGQEVLVEFEEGDPDRPLVTGRMYNADNMPPYTLPTNQTQTGMKTRSSKEGHDKTFNELRFEDKIEEEHIYFHAEKDFERVVENNDSLRVGFEKKDKGDQTIEIHNNQSLIVGNQESADGSQTIEIWKNRTETVKEGDETVTIEKGNRAVTVSAGDESLTVSQGKRTTEIQGDDSLTVKTGNLVVNVSAGKATITAAQSIELIVGASSIKIDPSSIKLNAATITVQGTAKVDVKAPMTSMQADVKADVKGTLVEAAGSAITMVKGGIVLIN